MTDGSNISGYTGTIKWILNDNLTPAENGYVTYRIDIK